MDGNLYLVDISNEYPTRIKVPFEKGKNVAYRLMTDDYVSLGLSDNFYVTRARSNVNPYDVDASGMHRSIRYL